MLHSIPARSELNQPFRGTHSGRNRNVHDFQRPMRWQEVLNQLVQVVEPAVPGRLARAIAQFNGVEKKVLALFKLPPIRPGSAMGKEQLECVGTVGFILTRGNRRVWPNFPGQGSIPRFRADAQPGW